MAGRLRRKEPMWSSLSQGTPLLARELHSLYPAPLSSTAIGDHTLPLLQHHEAGQLMTTNRSHSAHTARARARTHARTHSSPGTRTVQLSPSENEGARTSLGLASSLISSAQPGNRRGRPGAESVAEEGVHLGSCPSFDPQSLE